jgi:hypothetical protein
MADQWNELADRVRYLKELYAKKKIPLKSGEGITVAPDEAEAAAKGVPSPNTSTEDDLFKSVNACHVGPRPAKCFGGVDPISFIVKPPEY